MPRFFCEPENITSDKIAIMGDDAHHIERVLRMKIDDELTICDKHNTDYSCIIAEFTNNTVVLNIISTGKTISEPTVDITLYQALPKSDKMEFIIQKAVELGISRIVPMQSKFCVAKADKDFSKKLARYNKIAFEAAKQSGRGIIPQVLDILTFEQAIKATSEIKILYYEHGGKKTAEILSPACSKIAIYIGSEGGFSEAEVSFATQNGVVLGSLGKLILRCETAAVVASTIVLNVTNNI